MNIIKSLSSYAQNEMGIQKRKMDQDRGSK